MAQQTIEKIKQLIKRHADSIHTHHCGDEAEQIASILNHYERTAASAIGEKKDAIDGTLVYFRSLVMLCESIGMAHTHGEKNARLRGLVELLNSAIGKLKQEKTDALLNNWEMYSWSYSDYPYRGVIEKYNDLKRENEELKKLIPKQNDDLPM